MPSTSKPAEDRLKGEIAGEDRPSRNSNHAQYSDPVCAILESILEWTEMAAFWTQVCMYIVAIPLQVMILAAMLRGPYRRYPLFFVFMTASFLTTAAEVQPTLAVASGNRAAVQRRLDVYWVDETVMQIVAYAAVMSLLYEATARLKPRRIVLASVIGAAVLIAGISAAAHYEPSAKQVGLWMTPWTRDLNYYAEILMVALWGLLLGSRTRDKTFLLVCGGLGIKFAGEAISASIREIANIQNRAKAASRVGAMIGVASYLVFLYLEWRAFGKREAVAAGLKRNEPPPMEKRLAE